MGISKATLDRRRQESPEFRAFMDAAIAEGDTTLRRFQWKAARDGVPAMQIWLGKQRLAQKQNPEPERKRGLNLRVRYDDKGAANLRKNRKRLAKDRAVGSDDELDA